TGCGPAVIGVLQRSPWHDAGAHRSAEARHEAAQSKIPDISELQFPDQEGALHLIEAEVMRILPPHIHTGEERMPVAEVEARLREHEVRRGASFPVAAPGDHRGPDPRRFGKGPMIGRRRGESLNGRTAVIWSPAVVCLRW